MLAVTLLLPLLTLIVSSNSNSNSRRARKEQKQEQKRERGRGQHWWEEMEMNKNIADFLLKCAFAAADAYKPMAEISLSNAREYVTEYPDRKEKEQMTSSRTLDRMIMGSIVVKGKKQFVVAIRGTKEALNWAQNFDANLTTVEPLFSGEGKGKGEGDGEGEVCAYDKKLKVHRGYQGALHTLKPSGLYTALESLHREIDPDSSEKSVVLVGHSKGGGMAVQLAYHLLQKDWAVTLVTFGAPPSVNDKMVDYLNSRFHSPEGGGRMVESYRVVNSADTVPYSLKMMEGEADSYKHFGRAITLDNHIDALVDIVQNGVGSLKAWWGSKSNSKSDKKPKSLYDVGKEVSGKVIDHHMMKQYIANLDKILCS